MVLHFRKAKPTYAIAAEPNLKKTKSLETDRIDKRPAADQTRPYVGAKMPLDVGKGVTPKISRAGCDGTYTFGIELADIVNGSRRFILFTTLTSASFTRISAKTVVQRSVAEAVAAVGSPRNCSDPAAIRQLIGICAVNRLPSSQGLIIHRRAR